MRLACRLRELRLGRGLSIREVEERSGISRAYLSQIENGLRLPKDEWLGQLGAVYGAPVERWYGPAAGMIVATLERDDGSPVVGVAIERDGTAA